jgi:hypothetical protein
MPTSTPAILQSLTVQGTNLEAQGKLLSQTAAALYLTDLNIFYIIGLLITAGLTVGIVLLMAKTNWLHSRIDKWRHVFLSADAGKEQTRASWKEVERHFFAGDDNDLKVALIEADSALDGALRNAGVPGANLGDRLKKVKSAQLPNIEAVWQAHKLRNQIAHDDAYALKRDLAERALTVYKEALQTLGALEK